jgi:hypothetical protein
VESGRSRKTNNEVFLIPNAGAANMMAVRLELPAVGRVVGRFFFFPAL